jgi:hypothetical protein
VNIRSNKRTGPIKVRRRKWKRITFSFLPLSFKRATQKKTLPLCNTMCKAE